MVQCFECLSDVPEGSPRCPACGADLSPPATAWTEPVSESQPPSREWPAHKLLELVEQGQPRFIPGTVLLGRYRIISVLGRGGMGEVFRADDLQLGEQVALKFLAPELVGDDTKLARLKQEVRIARQVSHPLVCRVHDIAEVDGETFLSMEFIDGEDLGSLLKRIGRLSEDKGVQVARQLCDGLAAVHEQGILHRDLKPANIMIDGRGRVRVTDFGLAMAASATRGGAFHSGTPIYMAPEQLAGKPPTVASDLFSLGLVLYEVFTGRRAYPAKGRDDLARLHEEFKPSSVCDLVPALDPRIGKIIRQCLEQDPAQRPRSATAVAAALPRGDALATALAEGRTPSPEIVANAAEEGRIAPGVATALFAAVVLGVLAVAALAARATIVGLAPLPRSPDALAARARTILDRLGCTDQPLDVRFGFVYDFDGLKHAIEHDRTTSRWADVESGRVPATLFWFRQAAQYLTPGNMSPRQYPGVVSPSDPAPAESSVSVKLDPQGRLLEFIHTPGRRFEESPESRVDFKPLFDEARLDWQRAIPSQARWTPPFFADEALAWEAPRTDLQGPSLHVEGAAFGGRVVFFKVFHGPWEQPDPLRAPLENEPRAFTYLYAGLFGAIVLVAALLARQNQRAGRGDAVGATRLAIFLFACHLLSMALAADHVASFRGEAVWLMKALGYAGLWSALCWLLYFAFEPYVRRRWPWRMISWNRVLAGRVADPMVGRDLLIGALLGVGLTLLLQLAVVAPVLLGHVRPAPLITWPTGFTNVPFHLVMELPPAIRDSLLWFFLLFLLVLLVGRVWLASALVFTLVMTYYMIQEPELHFYWMALMGASLLASFVVATRFGLLAMTIGLYFCYFLYQLPLTLDPSSWYWWPSLAYMAWAIGLAAFGYWAARNGRANVYAPPGDFDLTTA